MDLMDLVSGTKMLPPHLERASNPSDSFIQHLLYELTARGLSASYCSLPITELCVTLRLPW